MIPHKLRKQYGEVYVISFPELDIPFKPLSYGDFLYYNELLEERLYPPAVLEDEIFKKCVVNSAIVNEMDNLNAGLISSTVQVVMEQSGPNAIDEFNTLLDIYRQKTQSPLHQMVLLICQAFPSYKPEDIYNMNVDTMMLRLAQAEFILISNGVLQEPIQLYTEQPNPQPKEPPQELKRAWEASQQIEKQQQQKVNKTQKTKKEAPKESKENNMQQKLRNQTPEFMKKRSDIPFDKEKKEMSKQGGATGWDKVDEGLLTNKMIKEAKELYGPWLEQLAKEQKETNNK